MKPIYRILIIEDDDSRVKTFTSWLPEGFRLVHAGSAGRALGILARDSHAYAGIMLDHDLQGQIVTKEDFFMSGTTVVKRLIEAIHPGLRPELPILVHSMNPADAPLMVKHLETAGFPVRRMPMAAMTNDYFQAWLDEVRECWEDRSA
jgi:CheY-like chemotaxis protein